MHLMAAPCERLGQFRGHDAAAANRRITHHPDMHDYLFKQMFTNHRFVYDDAFRKSHTSQCAELAVAAFDELIEARRIRSEEHTSELQSQSNLVCRLLLEKKKKKNKTQIVKYTHKKS